MFSISAFLRAREVFVRGLRPILKIIFGDPCLVATIDWLTVGVQLNAPISDIAGWETRKGKSEGEQFIVMSAS